MTSRPEIQCVSCAHWLPPLDRDDRQDVQLCGAFPDGAGIPEEIWWGRFDHRNPYPGDHGIQWEALEGAEFPEWAMSSGG